LHLIYKEPTGEIQSSKLNQSAFFIFKVLIVGDLGEHLILNPFV
jgi:hypothetical protein